MEAIEVTELLLSEETSSPKKSRKKRKSRTAKSREKDVQEVPQRNVSNSKPSRKFTRLA